MRIPTLRRLHFLWGLFIALLTAPLPVSGEVAAGEHRTMDLSGAWQFRLDPEDKGVSERWFVSALPDKIHLPGSTTENGFGDDVTVDTKWTGSIVDRSWFTDPKYEKYRQPGNVKIPFWLQPVKHYVGAAWYQREVEIVTRYWNSSRTVLFLERCHWETRVWVDGKEAGMRNSLSTPHEYDLTSFLTPGKHRLTIRVDNTVKIPVGENAHSVSDHTQTNWNGIIGMIELQGDSARVRIEDMQIYPDVAAKSALVKVTLCNTTGKPASGKIILRAHSEYSSKAHFIPEKTQSFEIAGDKDTIEITYPMGEDVLLWDEFTPNLYEMRVWVSTNVSSDTRDVLFGMRQIATDGTQFIINGKKRFVRGTLECCIFPLTGYPPTDVKSWERLIGIAKAHGLNHLRFHSWCPPEAAFIAADRMGFTFHIECAAWTTVGDGGAFDKFVYEEGDRILKAYGNHPSFCFLAYGNEPGGNNQNRFLGDLVEYWKKKDPRRLYTSAAGWPFLPQNQYFSSPDPRIQAWGGALRSRINARPPETMTDYRDFVARYKIPVISHEIGQWCVYPDFKEIAQYTGVTRARNFEIFRDSLRDNHMLDQAEQFLLASGKLQTLCYREEIESALRTPGFGGFQLLDLHDFPGQGTALVGVLNPFWGSKGYVTAEEYHRFACETVPLARLEKRVWTSNETFRARIEISHFGADPIPNAQPVWTIHDTAGKTIASGKLPRRDIPLGNGTDLGEITCPLSDIKDASKLVLAVSLEGTKYFNDWDVWVYPERADTEVPRDILLTQRLDDQALATLNAGGKVMLMPAAGMVKGDARGKVALGFSSIFCNTAWTRGQAPHTLGILCDPKHPALALFPTEYHGNWQWWYPIVKGQAMILNDLPPDFRPIVQVVDDWFTNRRLGLIFEARVSRGSLLVCGVDLESGLDKDPVRRQLRHSLLNYMVNSRFQPQTQLEAEQVRSLFRSPSSGAGGRVVFVDSEAEGYEGANALDGDPQTCWHTPWEGDAPAFPHEIRIALPKEATVRGITYLPRQDVRNGGIADYALYVSLNGQDWGEPVGKGRFGRDAEEKTILFEQPVQAGYIRLVALSGVEGQRFAAIAEMGALTDNKK